MSTSPKEASLTPPSSANFLPGGGEMGVLMRALDWAKTPLGDPEAWSLSLKMMVSFLLVNRFPLLLWWGPQYVQLYNDPYRPVLGAKHPRSMGQTAQECWSEIWSVIGPLIDTPFQGGPATWIEDLELEIHRHGFFEECHFTVAYSPVPDESAPKGIGGVLATVHEITEKVIAERRALILRDLGVRVKRDQSATEACEAAAQVLSGYPKDVPFALFYLLEANGCDARLAASAGVAAPERAIAPKYISLEAPEEKGWRWPLYEALRTESLQHVIDLEIRFECVPSGPWAAPPREAVVIPIPSMQSHGAAGFLVWGISSRLKFDAHYQDFLDLVRRQIAAAIANARAYEEERTRAEALAAIDQAKTAFFSNVSHEFRTPLTLMLGPIKEAADHPQTPVIVREQLQLAHRNSLRLLKLVNSLLDFSRIEAGRAEAFYEPMDLAALTRDFASAFRSAMERAGLKYQVECTVLDETVYVDPEMWEKIILNLLSNAFKFTLEGSVGIHLRRDGAKALLEVSDTGIGIAEQELPRLFERFHRIENAHARTHEGSGIGLALVRELVKLHGGTIEVVSTLGRGTTFRLRLPFGAAHLPAERIKAAPRVLGAIPQREGFVQEALRWLPEDLGSTSLEGRLLSEPSAELSDQRFAATVNARIVLADDNADMRTYVRNLLSSQYRVEAFADGAAALEAIRAEPPELVLTDVMMPRLDGFALLKALRADEVLRGIPVVMLSARAGEESRLEGLDAGADDYVIKPFSGRELLARVGALIELTRMRRENEERLRESEQKYRNLFEHMAEEVHFWKVIRDEQGIIQTWRLVDINPAALKTWGKSRDETVGRTADEIFPADENTLSATKHFMPVVQRVMQEGVAHSYETYYPAFKQHLKLTTVPFGEHFITTGADISALKRKEAALQDADRQKDEFLAMLAHELRNPLAPIRNANELLARLVPEDSRMRSAIEISRRQLAQLTRLVDDLLDVSRVTQGRIEMQLGIVEVSSIIAQAVETVQPLLREKQQRLSVLNLGNLALHVEADPTRLTQCVLNLLTNAAKYTDPGAGIYVQTRAEDGSVVIEVSDAGIGISPEFLPRVFDLFVQGERGLDRSQGGLGVGLAVVKRLVEMQHGVVTARSAGVGAGSTFQIRLPLIEPAASAESDQPSSTRTAKLRILIVDDNYDAANTLSALMQFEGHETHAAYSAQQAIRDAAAFHPEVVLLDIGLPDMDGYEVAKKLRLMPALRDSRLIALTGYGQPEDRRLAKAAGFNHHLVKPVDMETLMRILSGDAPYKGDNPS